MDLAARRPGPGRRARPRQRDGRAAARSRGGRRARSARTSSSPPASACASRCPRQAAPPGRRGAGEAPATPAPDGDARRRGVSGEEHDDAATATGRTARPRTAGSSRAARARWSPPCARSFMPRLAAYPGPTLIVNGEDDELFRYSERAFLDGRRRRPARGDPRLRPPGQRGPARRLQRGGARLRGRGPPRGVLARAVPEVRCATGSSSPRAIRARRPSWRPHAEAAGWDGVFTWDGIAIGPGDTYDPWVVDGRDGDAHGARPPRGDRHAAGASPAVEAGPRGDDRSTASSGGRLVLPVGLGALDDAAFGNVGEPTDARTRAELLDESLAILEGLWSGEPFAFAGRHYRFGPMTFRPTPVQRPRIPVWVVGAWPAERSMARAARWDGIIPQARDAAGTPRPSRRPASSARSSPGSPPRARPTDGAGPTTSSPRARRRPAIRAPLPRRSRRFADAGATWWIEADWEGSTRARRSASGSRPARPAPDRCAA